MLGTHYAKLIDKCIGEQMDKFMDTFSGEADYSPVKDLAKSYCGSF